MSASATLQPSGMGPVSIAATHHSDSSVDMDLISLHCPLVPIGNVILPVVVNPKLRTPSDGAFADVTTVTHRVFSGEWVRDLYFAGFHKLHALA